VPVGSGAFSVRQSRSFLMLSAASPQPQVTLPTDIPAPSPAPLVNAAATAHAGPNEPVWKTHLGPQAALSDLYHEVRREDLLQMLRLPLGRVLDVGCAGGCFGEILKQQYAGVHVTGIETHAGAAAIAAKRLDHVIRKPIEDVDFDAEGIPAGSLDVIVLADVLEHLYDPWRALVRLRPLLAPTGYLLISVPNARNLGMLSLLADRGVFPYTSAGLLDITHIRFFTARELNRMLTETGFRMELGSFNIDGRFEAAYERNKDRSNVTLQVGRMSMAGLSGDDVLELCTWQWLARAIPGPA
jgi:O-antigen biosynthesis protein